MPAVRACLFLLLFAGVSWPQENRYVNAQLGWHAPVLSLVALLMLGLGVQNFVSTSLASKPPAARVDLDEITRLATAIATFARDYDLKTPTMSSDRIADYQNIGTVKLFSIEALHRNLTIDPRFGHGQYGIFATSREDALRLFADSDIIVLTDAVTADQQHQQRFRRLVSGDDAGLIDGVDNGEAGRRIGQIVDKFSQLGAPASVADVSDALRRDRRIPSAVWLGSAAVTPESYFVSAARVAAELLAGHPLPEQVEFRPAALEAAK